MNLNDALNSDPILETEKIFNKRWNDFDEFEKMTCLLKGMEVNEQKRQYFKNSTDIYTGISWKDFKELFLLNNFKIAYSYNFNYEERKEEFILLYKKEKGLIICADSFYNMQEVNGGHLYGEIQANNKKSCNDIFRYLSTGGCINQEKMIYETQQDIREGIFSKLALLESFGNFLPYWTNQNRFLWFVDYVETENKKYDYKKIAKEKIEKCPQDFKDIIRGLKCK